MDSKKKVVKRICKTEKKMGRKRKLIKVNHRLAFLRSIKRKTGSRVKEFPFIELKERFEMIIKDRVPVLIRDVPDVMQKNQEIDDESKVEMISKLLEKLEIKTIDASISEDQKFSGHYSANSRVSISFEKFLEYSGQYVIYIAQLPLFERIKNNENERQRLDEVLDAFPVLFDLATECRDEIERINLWISRKNTFSSLHYDSYDNFLFMIKGTKIFRIYEPDDANVTCESILTNSYHQAKLTGDGPNSVREIKVTEGQGIFLPQGWYHEVESFGDDNIIAVNLWFSSIKDLCDGRRKYLMRYLLSSQIEDEIKVRLEEFEEASYSQNHPDFKSALFKTPESKLRNFLKKILLKNGKIFEDLILSLDMWGVEFLTSSLEKIDNKICSEQEIKEMDDFYEVLNQKSQFQKIQEHFLNSKKVLREHVLQIVLNKLSESYEF